MKIIIYLILKLVMGYQPQPQPQYTAIPMPTDSGEQMHVTPVVQQPDGMGGMTWAPDYSSVPNNNSQFLSPGQNNANVSNILPSYRKSIGI